MPPHGNRRADNRKLPRPRTRPRAALGGTAARSNPTSSARRKARAARTHSTCLQATTSLSSRSGPRRSPISPTRGAVIRRRSPSPWITPIPILPPSRTERRLQRPRLAKLSRGRSAPAGALATRPRIATRRRRRSPPTGCSSAPSSTTCNPGSLRSASPCFGPPRLAA